jgi:hypothetical protein
MGGKGKFSVVSGRLSVVSRNQESGVSGKTDGWRFISSFDA